MSYQLSALGSGRLAVAFVPGKTMHLALRQDGKWMVEEDSTQDAFKTFEAALKRAQEIGVPEQWRIAQPIPAMMAENYFG